MPGQNLYLIEIDGKRLLVGGTQQGGVQFVADLTQSMSKNEKLDFRQAEEYKIPSKSTIDMALANGMNSNNKETPFIAQDILENKNMPDEIKQNGLHGRQTFKRRTNFRKSLFSENMNNAEDLLRKV
jgi:hypoxanthine-guanine phosphoribosyltransferase